MKRLVSIALLFLVVKVGVGQLMFNKNYDVDSTLDVGVTVIQTLDGGYMAAGNSLNLFTNNNALFVSRTDPSGDTLWLRVFDLGPAGDYPGTLLQVDDTTFVIAGQTKDTSGTNWESYLLALNGNGDTLWFKLYGGNDVEAFQDVIRTNDSGYLSTGITFSNTNGSSDGYLVKTDSIGNIEWEKHYGGLNADHFNDVIQLPDSSYMCVGRYQVGAGDKDIWLMKIANNGDSLWMQLYGGPEIDDGRSIIRTNDGDFAIAGLKEISGNNEGLIMKTDSAGNVQWEYTFKGGPGTHVFTDIAEVAGGALVAGGSCPDYLDNTFNDRGLLIKVSAAGDSLWSRIFGGTNNNGTVPDYFFGIAPTSDGGFIMTGQLNRIGYPYQNFWLVKVDSMGCDTPGCDSVVVVRELPIEHTPIKVFPNPTTGKFTVANATAEIQIFDLFGRLVLRTNEAQIDMSSYPAGLYIWQVGTSRGKLVLE